MRISRFLAALSVIAAILLPQTAISAAQFEIALVIEERLDGRVRPEDPLRRTVTQFLKTLMIAAPTARQKALTRHSKIIPLLNAQGSAARILDRSSNDVALIIALDGRSEIGADGRARYHAHFRASLVVGNQRTTFDVRDRSSASTLSQARRFAVRQLMTRAWTKFRPRLETIKRGASSIRVILDAQRGQPPGRLAAAIESLKQVRSVDVLQAQPKVHLLIAPARRYNVNDLTQALAKAFGLKLERTQWLSYTAQVDANNDGRKRLQILRPSAPAQLSQLAALVPGLLSSALENAPSVVATSKNAEPVNLKLSAKSLSASVAGKTLRVRFRDPVELPRACMEMARLLDQRFHRRPRPRFGQLRGGLKLRSADLYALFASEQDLRGQGRSPRIKLAGSAKVALTSRLDHPANKSELAASGRTFRPLVQVDPNQLLALTTPTATSMRFKLQITRGKRILRDDLVIPVIIWPHGTIDRGNLATITALVAEDSPALTKHVSDALKRLNGHRQLRRIEEPLWLTMVAFALSARPSAADDAPAFGRLQALERPSTTLSKGSAGPHARAVLFAACLRALGGDGMLWRDGDRLIVAVNLSVPRGSLALADTERQQLLSLGDTLWLPLEMGNGQDFAKAWQHGYQALRHKYKRLARAPFGAGAMVALSKPTANGIRIHSGGTADVSAQLGRAVSAITSRRDHAVRQRLASKTGNTKHVDVARSLIRLRAIDKADALLRKSLTINANDSKAHLLAGVVAVMRGTYNIAQRHFQSALPSRAARINLALLQFVNGKRKQAFAQLKKLGSAGRRIARNLAQVGKTPYNARQARALALLAGASAAFDRRKTLLGETAESLIERLHLSYQVMAYLKLK